MLPVTDAFREALDAALEPWGSKSELARQLDVDHSTLSALCEPGRVKNSTLIAPICRALGWAVPGVGGDPELMAALDRVREADPDLYERIRNMALGGGVPKPTSPVSPGPIKYRRSPRPSR